MPPDVEGWLGRDRVEDDVLTASQARRLAATIERGPDRLEEGVLLPPGWHWIYFGTPVPRARLGPDGHERLGAFLPDLPYPRRMWAGGRIRFERPLRLGERVSRRSTVEAVTPKEGRSGPLVFVTVRHRITGPSGLAVDEEQELVYRSAPDGWASREGAPASERSSWARTSEGPGPVHAAPTEGPNPVDAAPTEEPAPSWSETFVADEVLLFRFSALTFNAHRIHYDRPFAVEADGYPALVVHGPLLALLLLEAATRHVLRRAGPEGALGWTFRYRALRPVFCGEPFDLVGTGEAGTVRAIHRGRGVLVEAELAESVR